MTVSLRDILRFYVPLVLTSQMMTLSGPIINVAVGRSADPTLELAGYWIGFTILLFIESPCLVSQSVTATLARGYGGTRRVLLCVLSTAVLCSLAVLAVALTPLGNFVFDHLVRTTPRAAELARTVLGLLAPVPLLIALRGVGNGIAIAEKRTVLVARATLLRMLAISAVVGVVVGLATGSGARAGVAAFLTGVSLETAMIWIGVRPYWRARRAARRSEGPILPYRQILQVALPLVVSAFAWTSFRPVVNAILGRLSDPELAQAAFGFVMPLVLLLSSPLWTLQNVSLILPESRADLRKVIRFAGWMSALFVGVILVFTVTPIRDLLLRHVFSLPVALERAVVPALLLLAIEPVLLAARSLSQGLLMRAKRTGAFLIVAPAKIALVACAGLLVVAWNPEVDGALLGTLLFLGSDLFEGIVYSLTARHVVRTYDVFSEVAVPALARRV